MTHDQIEVMTLAAKIVVFNKGMPQQIAAPYEIYNQPANVFVVRFVGTPPINTWRVPYKAVRRQLAGGHRSTQEQGDHHD